jgi:hypothetical protein
MNTKIMNTVFLIDSKKEADKRPQNKEAEGN